MRAGSCCLPLRRGWWWAPHVVWEWGTPDNRGSCKSRMNHSPLLPWHRQSLVSAQMAPTLAWNPAQWTKNWTRIPLRFLWGWDFAVIIAWNPPQWTTKGIEWMLPVCSSLVQNMAPLSLTNSSELCGHVSRGFMTSYAHTEWLVSFPTCLQYGNVTERTVVLPCSIWCSPGSGQSQCGRGFLR